MLYYFYLLVQETIFNVLNVPEQSYQIVIDYETNTRLGYKSPDKSTHVFSFHQDLNRMKSC